MVKKSETSWLGMLKMELALLDDIVEPENDDELSKGETALGVAGDEAKRLWTYFIQTEEKATRTLIDAKYCRASNEEREALERKATELKAKAEMARSILFLSLRDQFGVWNPRVGIGIRKGFIVTTFKDNSNPLLDLLRGAM